jgi:hypothetical protein
LSELSTLKYGCSPRHNILSAILTLNLDLLTQWWKTLINYGFWQRLSRKRNCAHTHVSIYRCHTYSKSLSTLWGKTYMCLKLSIAKTGKSLAVFPKWCKGWENFDPSAVRKFILPEKIYRQQILLKMCTSKYLCITLLYLNINNETSQGFGLDGFLCMY